MDGGKCGWKKVKVEESEGEGRRYTVRRGRLGREEEGARQQKGKMKDRDREGKI